MFHGCLKKKKTQRKKAEAFWVFNPIMFFSMVFKFSKSFSRCRFFNPINPDLEVKVDRIDGMVDFLQKKTTIPSIPSILSTFPSRSGLIGLKNRHLEQNSSNLNALEKTQVVYFFKVLGLRARVPHGRRWRGVKYIRTRHGGKKRGYMMGMYEEHCWNLCLYYLVGETIRTWLHCRKKYKYNINPENPKNRLRILRSLRTFRILGILRTLKILGILRTVRIPGILRTIRIPGILRTVRIPGILRTVRIPGILRTVRILGIVWEPEES